MVVSDGQVVGWVGGRRTGAILNSILSRYQLIAFVTQNNTLIKYLLDELGAYETDHTAALSPLRLQENTASFLGEHKEMAPVTLAQHRHDVLGLENKLTALGATLETKMDAMVDNILTVVRSGFPVPPSPTRITAPPSHFPSAPLAPELARVVVPGPSASPSPLRPRVQLPQPGDAIPTSLPEPKYCDGEPKYLAVVRDWKFADPSRGLYHALKDWEPEWYSWGTVGSRLHGAKYSQRRWIALEFIERCVPSVCGDRSTELILFFL